MIFCEAKFSETCLDAPSGNFAFFITHYLSISAMIRFFIVVCCALWSTIFWNAEIYAYTQDSTIRIEASRIKTLELIRAQSFEEALALAKQEVVKFPHHASTHLTLAQVYLSVQGHGAQLTDSAGFKAQQAVAQALQYSDTSKIIDELVNWVLTAPNTGCQLSMRIGKLFYANDMPRTAIIFLNNALTECTADSNAAYSRYLLAQCLLNTTWQKSSANFNASDFIHPPDVIRQNLLTALRLLKEGMTMQTTATYFYSLLGDIHTELAILNDSNKTEHEAIATSAYKAAIIAAINRKAARGFIEDTAKTDGKLRRTARFDDFALQDTEPNVDIRALARKVVYPPEAKNIGMAGKIMTMVYVNRYGDIKAIIVYTKDAEPFEPSITNAIMNTPFTPAKEGRISVGSLVTIPFIFRIR